MLPIVALCVVCLIHREKSAFVDLNRLRHGTLCAFSWDPFLLSDNTVGFKSPATKSTTFNLDFFCLFPEWNLNAQTVLSSIKNRLYYSFKTLDLDNLFPHSWYLDHIHQCVSHSFSYCWTGIMCVVAYFWS